MESIEVDVTNILTRDTLTLYLNPAQAVWDLKKELKEKGIMEDDDGIFFDDIELPDDQKISGTKITQGSMLEIRQKDEEEKE
jgi:hypothetical protein